LRVFDAIGYFLCMLIDYTRLPRFASQPNSQCSGFALVLALSLMGFVLVLLLTIIAFVRVESRSSFISRERLLAENNALLALQVALGNLQMSAGPDQRITANAKILDTVNASKQNYTVVWDSQISPGEVTAPMAWLASGATESDFDATTQTNANWPELVSARSDAAIEAVRVEPVTILNTNGASAGEMAWWVGDEGVKAKFNLTESSYLREATTDSDLRLGTSARFGIEALENIDTIYDYAAEDFYLNLQKLVSREQAPLLNDDLQTPLNDYFHDIGFFSRGLLTNVKDGGLKEDLTHYFEGNSGELTGAIRSGGTSAMDRITWEQLQSFYKLADNLDEDGISVRAQTEDTHGVYPLLTMLHLNFGLTMESHSEESVPVDPADRIYSVYAHMRPWFVLSNPYTTALKVSNYRIRFDQWTDAHFQISYGAPGSTVDLIDYSYKDLLQYMVFVIPEVTIEPGEALYFSLSPTTNSSYDYQFNIDTGGYYSPYHGFQSAQTQQFVFEASDDDGLTSIRLGDAEVVHGNVIEDGNLTDPRIQQMYVSIDNVGAYWLRTYIGASQNLNDAEEILQDIGRFGSAGVAYDSEWRIYHGYWSIDLLPNTLSDFDTIRYPRDQPVTSADPAPYTLRSSSLSSIYVMHSAINQDVDGLYSGYDGWATDYNIRAPRMARYKEVQKYPVAYELQESPNGSAWFDWIRDPNVGNAPNFPWAAGYSRTNSSGDDPVAKVYQAILFDIPELDPNTGQAALASLGQLQHFNAGGWTENVAKNGANYSIELDSMAYSSSMVIGNSYAPPQIARDATTSEDTGVTFSDVGYLLNDALFDGYFFSSIPQGNEDVIDYESLPNKRLIPMTSDVDDASVRSTGTAAAENLFVDGAFNVNSTSVAAWYSLLNSFRGLDFGSKSDGQGIFPRSLNQSPEYVEGDVDGVTDDDEAWAGWRHIEDDASDLEDRKLYQLAEAIVEEVKARGPFVSMSDFVNRRLIANDETEARLGLSGALQAAIDRTLNLNFSEAYQVNPDKMASGWYSATEHLTAEGIVDESHLGSGPISSSDGSETLAAATSAASMPGWVLQGDLLQALAPALSVRSDTFTIRSYGNVLDPVNGDIIAESYIEAVVQRSPSYIDSSDDANVFPPLSTENLLAGRKFQIVSIRRLNESDL
jgi:hypothetical protein